MQDHSKDTSVSRGSSVNSTRVITKPSPSEKQIQKIFQQLDDSTKRRDELSKAFLCKQDVQQIWSNIQDIREVFWPEIWAKYELEIVQLKFIKILSVLVLISAHTCIKNFRNTFFQTIQQATSCTDDDLPLAKEDLDQILQPSLARLFLEKQYVLIPFLIEDSEEQQIHRISEAYRLPFTKEKVGIGWGGYGTVDEVEIASGYLKQGDGAIFPYNKAIARKRIETDKNEEDFEKEVKNLQILKESLTSHSRIMRHLATIIHGSSFNILLPLAFFGDLELLLNDGISYNNPRKPQILYNFDSRFPGLTQQNLPEAILSEFSHLADGLRWLHDELCIVDGPELYCAHMDLKPSNILVDRDRHSLVGRWMLSDFGISVFRASTGRQDSQFASIGDVHAELTLQTRAKRGHGPYQAPEVQMLGPNTVGRRSDIWSLGCIFSEVLVFAIGRAPLLHKFRQARRNTYDDYFYSPRRESLSVVPGNGAYELRPSVKKWLEKLPNELVPPQQWVKCCVGTFLSILVVNDNLRPSAEDTGNLLKHAKEHLRTSMYGLPLQCRNLDHELPVQSSTNIPRGGMPLPALSIRTSLDLSPQAETSSALEDVQEQNESEVEARKVVTNVARQPEHISLENELSNINNSETYQGSLDTQSPTGLGLSGSSRTDSEPSLASAQRGHSIFSDNRVESGGIQIGPDVSRKSLGSHGRKLPPYVSYFKLTKSEARNTIALAISPHGNRVAYLCPDRLWIYSIKLYERPSVLENMEYLDLSSDKGWEMLTIAGMYIAAWGYSKVNAKRLIFLGYIGKPLCAIPVPDHVYDFKVSSIAISCRGVVAFIESRKLYLMFLESVSLLLLSCSSGYESRFDTSFSSVHNLPQYYKELAALPNYMFHQAEFSANGQYLYAWAYGDSHDRLCVWTITSNSANPYHECQFVSKHYGNNNVLLLPYESSLGCVVRTPDKGLFVGQFPTLHRDSPNVFTREETIHGGLQLACVLQNQSVVMVRTGQFPLSKARLLEHDLEATPAGTHRISRSGHLLCQLKSKVQKGSRLKAIQLSGTQVVIICGLDGFVEIIILK